MYLNVAVNIHVSWLGSRINLIVRVPINPFPSSLK